MEIKITCPLGHDCETATDNVVHRCAWYTEVKGEHPQTGEAINQSKCAMTWLPMMMVEQARQQRSTAAVLESTRNIFKAATDNMIAVEENKPLRAVGD